MAPLSVLLALMLAQAHPGTSIISGPQDKQALRQDKDSQSRRIGVGLAVIPGPAPSVSVDESKESRAQAEQKRGAQLSGQASHIHGTVYGGEGFGQGGGGFGQGGGGFSHGGGGFDGYAGHHGGSGLGFYGGGGGAGGFGGDIGGGLGGGLDGGLGGGHIDYGHHHLEHHHDSHYHKALAVKSLLVPLAGVALLGAAAAFVTNPILLQLGVISGKRRRRAAAAAAAAASSEDDQEQVQRMAQVARQRVGDLQLLENFMSQIPRAEARAQEQRLLASYLTCTGIVPTSPPPAASSSSSPSSSSNDSANALLGLGSSASCLERLSCELHQDESAPGSSSGALERHVMRVVTGEILSNEFISESVKSSVQKAVLRGKAGDDCSKYYPCQDLDDKSD